MAAVMFGSFGLFILITLPVITYYYAKHLGRNPKVWCIIGIILPGIATLILSFLPEVKEKKDPDA